MQNATQKQTTVKTQAAVKGVKQAKAPATENPVLFTGKYAGAIERRGGNAFALPTRNAGKVYAVTSEKVVNQALAKYREGTAAGDTLRAALASIKAGKSTLGDIVQACMAAHPAPSYRSKYANGSQACADWWAGYVTGHTASKAKAAAIIGA